MKNIKDFILEASDAQIKQVLSQKKIPWGNKLINSAWRLIPNVEGFTDNFDTAYEGEYWAVTYDLRDFDAEASLPVKMIPYISYVKDFDFYDELWKKASKKDQDKTIDMLLDFIDDLYAPKSNYDYDY